MFLKFLVTSLLFLCISLPHYAQEKTEVLINSQLNILKIHPNDGGALRKLGLLYLNKGDYNKAIYFANRLRELGDSTDNDYYRVYSYICFSQGYMMLGRHKQAKSFMDKSLNLALRIKNDSALCSVYNGLGLYALNVELDYYKSIKYFIKGIEVAQRCPYESLYSILLTNMAGVYYLKKDTVGLKYSLECYNLGHDRRDPYLVYAGATNSAYMYFLKKDYQTALKYIQEAEFVMNRNNFYNQSNVYNLYGNILSAMKEYKPAIDYFKKSLAQKEYAQSSSIADTYLQYGKTVMVQRKYSEAIPLLLQGLRVSKENSNTIFLGELYAAISDCYEHLSLYKESLEYYKAYKIEDDLRFNADKERSLADIRVKYDMVKQENDLRESKLLLVKKEKRIQLMSIVFIAILIMLGLIYAMYKRKQALYQQIVKQNSDSVKRELNLLQQIDLLQDDSADKRNREKYALSSLSEAKSMSLFEEIEKLMKNKKVYKDKDITKEKLADMLKTNRSYLSQVINERSGLTFSHYINAYRINEAIRILSDKSSSIPLKALAYDLGFNSITTFYSVFKSKVGMTPSTYRENVMKLNSSN